MARDEAYLEAEKKIEEALKSGATELDLSGQYKKDSPKLTELPESLWQLTQLQKLDLSNNQLTTLPEPLGQFTQLQELTLSNNQLTALPESLEQLTQLQTLKLPNNQLAMLPDSLAALGKLTQLQNLNLSANQLARFPDSLAALGKLTQLQSLDLSSNQLTTLPELLAALTQLGLLDLSSNKLVELPEYLAKFKHLHTLIVRENQLDVLPVFLRGLSKLKILRLSNNNLTRLPDWIDEFSELDELEIAGNQLHDLPLSFKKIQTLRKLYLGIDENGNPLVDLPIQIRSLINLDLLWLDSCKLSQIPSWIAELTKLDNLSLNGLVLHDLSLNVSNLINLKYLYLDNNPLNPELTEAYNQGLDAVKAYLRAKSEAQIILNEAKLILVGEGEVGKSCLMDALVGNPWQEHETTHGIEIKQIKVIAPDGKTEISLNGWDFGGQRVYRPTHQLFFSAPALYLVVWKPREGPQQGFVKEWIQLIKRREPSAKILVVATHGGPKQRQPDIDRQELWDLFGKDTIIDFFQVESKPDKKGNRRGMKELKKAIARVATQLPEMGRSVPETWQRAREALQKTKKAYIPFDDVLKICHRHKMDDEQARLFITIEHRLGQLIHYQNDPALRDIVVLKPDWLTTAISFVLDDEETRKNHGLVRLSRLSQLWNDPKRPKANRYSTTLHQIFIRLMERFDLCYRVAGLSPSDGTDPAYLIAQLVPDTRPEQDLVKEWIPNPDASDIQQAQICQIVDKKNGQSASAEGLFYQLIVRLHKYSLGRVHYNDSIHWQRGLVLDNDYNGRAMLENIGNDVRITVRAPYPEFFLAMLTAEVKYLVEGFWEGLRCDVMVRCLNTDPCGGLFEVGRLIENKKRGRPDQPCPICNEWQNIDRLLLNAPDSRPIPAGEILANQEVLSQLSGLRQVLIKRTDTMMGRFDHLDAGQKELFSKAEASFSKFIQIFTDEAKEGPRLFSMRPIDSNWLEKPKQLVSQKFRVLLWCEHSQLPLFVLNEEGDKRGMYELDLPYEWVVKAAPYLKALTATLSLILPVASSATKLLMNEKTYEDMKDQLAFGKDVFDSILKGSDKLTNWNDKSNVPDLPHGAMQRAEGALLREFHSFLKEKDPGFGGLVRVMNKRQEFLWVHEKFASEY